MNRLCVCRSGGGSYQCDVQSHGQAATAFVIAQRHAPRIAPAMTNETRLKSVSIIQSCFGFIENVAVAKLAGAAKPSQARAPTCAPIFHPVPSMWARKAAITQEVIK